MNAFWSSIGGKLADRLATVSAPAIVFWFGGLLAWSYTHGGFSALMKPAAWLGQQPYLTQAAILLVALVGVVASGLVVDRLTAPGLRVLEGYWPAGLDRLRRRLTDRVQRRADADDAEFQDLSELLDADRHTSVDTPTRQNADLLARYARVDRARRGRPSTPGLLLPTKIGNILLAAETRPMVKYGLDAAAIWPRLWLLMPESTRHELVAARTALDRAVGASIWGILFCAFTPWTLLALPAGLVVSAVAIVAWVPTRAQVFGELVEAAYDIHRTALYRQLRWPLPANPLNEHLQGERLTRYLRLGSLETEPHFIPPP